MFKEWPNDCPNYFNACTDPCDSFVGFCCCGAHHEDGEFDFKDGSLYRFNRWVSGRDPLGVTADNSSLEEIDRLKARIYGISWGFNEVCSGFFSREEMKRIRDQALNGHFDPNCSEIKSLKQTGRW